MSVLFNKRKLSRYDNNIESDNYSITGLLDNYIHINATKKDTRLFYVASMMAIPKDYNFNNGDLVYCVDIRKIYAFIDNTFVEMYEYEEDNDFDELKVKTTKCKQCGAPLDFNKNLNRELKICKCDYCRTYTLIYK